MMSSSSRRSSVGSDFRRNMRISTSTGDTVADNESAGSEGDGMFKVPIIGYEVMDERARFTAFKLRVENEKANDSWLVFRRYTDFERLCAKLKEEHPTLAINLPPKRWLRDNFDTVFLDDRMKGLQAFVDCILIQYKLGNTATVREFFCLDEPPLYPENAEESKAIFGTMEENVNLLKQALHERDSENELLRAELALVKTQLENLSRATRNCRNCNRRQSLPLSPSFKSENSPIPVASSTPNNAETTPRSKSSLPNNFHSPAGTPKGKNFILAAGNSSSEHGHGLNGKIQLFSTPSQLERRNRMDSPQSPISTPKTSNKPSSVTVTSRNLPSSTHGKTSPSASERSDSSLESSEPKSSSVVQSSQDSPVSTEQSESTPPSK